MIGVARQIHAHKVIELSTAQGKGIRLEDFHLGCDAAQGWDRCTAVVPYCNVRLPIEALGRYR
jgi:hypothetical protein